MKNEIKLALLRELAEANGGRLLTLSWLGSNVAHQFSFSDGRLFWMNPHNLKANGWPKDPDRYLRTYSKSKDEINLARLREAVESSGGTLLSDKWLGIDTPHHMTLPDGRDFWMTPYNFKSRGFPKNPDLHIRNFTKNGIEARYNELKSMAEANGYTLLSERWLGATKKHDFMKDGVIISVMPVTLLKRGWPADIKAYENRYTNKRDEYQLGRLRDKANSYGGKLLSTQWLDMNASYEFMDAAGNTFSKSAATVLNNIGFSPFDKNITEHICAQIMSHLFQSEFSKTRDVVVREGQGSLELDGYAVTPSGLKVAFEYQGHDKHRTHQPTITKDREKADFCRANQILLVVIDPISYHEGWDRDYMVNHVTSAVDSALKKNGIILDLNDTANFQIDYSRFNHAKVMLDKLSNLAESHGGKLLSTEWRGAGQCRYDFMHSDGREFSAAFADLISEKPGWPVDLDNRLKRSSINGKDELHYERLKSMAEEAGLTLLSPKWINSNAKYKFAFKDGREFSISYTQIHHRGLPKDPDAYFRKSKVNGDRGELFLTELQAIAEANGGKLNSTEYKDTTSRLSFTYADGRQFESTYVAITTKGWPKDIDHRHMWADNDERNSLRYNRLKDLAKEAGLGLVSPEWIGGDAKYKFAFKDGREFSISYQQIKRRGLPKDPDAYFRQSMINGDRCQLLLEEMRAIAEFNGGKLISTEYKNATAGLRFIHADGGEFEVSRNKLSTRGWPKSSSHPNRKPIDTPTFKLNSVEDFVSKKNRPKRHL